MGMTPTQAKRLGALFQQARIRKRLSLRDVAGQLDIPTSWLGFMEQGRFVDPAPTRLARLAELLDIAPARVDRISRGALRDGLPGPRAYFRAKYDLTADETKQVERYIERLRKAAA